MEFIQYKDKFSIIPSLRKGDFIHTPNGHVHQIINWLIPRITYNTRNLVTGNLDDVSITVDDDFDELKSSPTQKVEEEWYLQVTGLHPTRNEATLKLCGRDEANRTIKVVDEEDLELIRGGLIREDQEVFCTVVKIMGKEVMGNIKILPKDPFILGMPDLVMDNIFSYLSLEDRLNCRIVKRNWGLHHLPVHRILNCSALMIGLGRKSARGYFRSFPSGKGLIEYEVNIRDLQPFIESSVLSDVEELRIHTNEKPLEESEYLIKAILKHVRKAKSFHFHCGSSPYSDLEIWPFIKKFMANNEGTLKTSRICTFAEEVVDLRSLIGNGSSFEMLELSLGYESVLRNLEFLPTSIKHLSLVGLSVPLTRGQVTWIVTNLTKLHRLDLHVEYKVDNVRNYLVELISEVLGKLKGLKGLNLLFDFHNNGEVEEVGGVGVFGWSPEFNTLSLLLQDNGELLKPHLDQDIMGEKKWNIATSIDLSPRPRFIQELKIWRNNGEDENKFEVLYHRYASNWLRR